MEFYPNLKKYTVAAIALLLFACCSTAKAGKQLPDAKAIAGVAKLTVKASGLSLEDGKDALHVQLNVLSPFSASFQSFEGSRAEGNSWSFEAPVDCSPAMGAVIIATEKNAPSYVVVFLEADKETALDISFDETGMLKIKSDSQAGFTSDDLAYLPQSMYKFHTYRYAHRPTYQMSRQEYLENELRILEERSAYALDGFALSDNAKRYLLDFFKLSYLKGRLFTYKKCMELDYLNINKTLDGFTPPEFSHSYYAFLRNFDLNNPQYLYNEAYVHVLQYALDHEPFSFPPVGETSIADWLEAVKDTLAVHLGFNDGLFYDMLAASSYIRQLEEKAEPLSVAQLGHIRSYFRDSEIARILIRKNDDVRKQAENLNPLAINQVPDAPKEELVNAILAKHRGKVAVFDFWATWCGPCVQAIAKLKEVKSVLKDKDVVYVYLTNSSSPKELWSDRIKGIGGEHYYLSDDEWQYLMDSFGFEAIPSYVIFGKNGVVKHKLTGYPGNDKLMLLIEELL